MIVLIIVFYFVIGFGISCIYNALHDVPIPPWMTEDQKNDMFAVMTFWPICILYWFFSRFIKTIKWLLKK